MNPDRPLHQRLLRLAVLAVFVVFAFWFLAGPNGLFSIGRRRRREQKVRADITEFRQKIEEREQRKQWLLNQDSASVLARQLLGDKPDSASAPR